MGPLTRQVGHGKCTMVNNKNISWLVLGVLSVFTVAPGRAEACNPPDFRGRVKSIVETEAAVDLMTGRIGEARVADRIDFSRDGNTVEMTVYAPGSAEPRTTFRAYFERGKLLKEIEVVNGKTVSTTTCSYDGQGRLLEARTQSSNGEGSTVETYEYGAGLIRRQVSAFGGPPVITQTLDSSGRVVKEVMVDETTSTTAETIDFTYTGDREEMCSISSRDPIRQCITTVRDSHGNEIEVRAEGQTRKISREYDAVGNWISERTAIIRPRGTVETFVRRKIEYY